MALSLEQLAYRRRGIGASEIAAVCGLSKWARPIDVWLAKTGQAETSPPTDATRRGDFLEPALRDWYADEHGRDVQLRDTMQHPEHPIALATPDGIATLPGGEDPVLLEIKSPGRHTQYDWGEAGTDGVPAYYMPQVIWGMAVAGVPRAHVVALVHGELRLYEVDQDMELFGEMLSRAQGFWDRYVKRNAPPPPEGSRQYADFLARKFQRASQQAEALTGRHVDTLLMRLAKAEEAQKTAAYRADKVRAELKAMMRERGRAEGVVGHVTWTNNRDSERTDWKAVALQMCAPTEIIARFTKTLPGARVFRSSLNVEASQGVGGAGE